jgi:hypothetical protein
MVRFRESSFPILLRRACRQKSVPKVCESNMRSEENRLDTTTGVRRVSPTQAAAHAFQKEKYQRKVNYLVTERSLRQFLSNWRAGVTR